MLKGKTVKRSIAALVIFAVTMSFVFVSSMFVQAEEINESNPDLTFYFIDSDLENIYRITNYLYLMVIRIANTVFRWDILISKVLLLKQAINV